MSCQDCGRPLGKVYGDSVMLDRPKAPRRIVCGWCLVQGNDPEKAPPNRRLHVGA